MDEGRPYPIELADMDGEWSGLGAEEPDILLTLRVDTRGKTLLALAHDEGSSITTKVVEMTDWRVQNGQFNVRSVDGEWTLHGEGSRSWHIRSYGFATLSWRDPKRGPHETKLHMFSVGGKSWMKRMLGLARRYALL